MRDTGTRSSLIPLTTNPHLPPRPPFLFPLPLTAATIPTTPLASLEGPCHSGVEDGPASGFVLGRGLSCLGVACLLAGLPGHSACIFMSREEGL